MSKITTLAALTWLLLLSTSLSVVLWLGLRIARAKSKAEARSAWLFELARRDGKGHPPS